MVSANVELPYEVDDAWQRVRTVVAQAGKLEQANLSAHSMTGTVRYGLNRVRLHVSVSSGVSAGSATLAIDAHDRDARGVASQIVIDRLLDQLTASRVTADPRRASEVPLAPKAAVQEASSGPDVPLAMTASRRDGRRRGRTVAAVVIVIGVVVGGVFGVGAILSAPSGAVEVHGYAILSSPLTGARIDFYLLNGKGQQGTVLARTTTNSHGYFTATLSHPGGQDVLVVTSGGRYVDEITHQRVAADAHDSLRSIITPGETAISITPLSTLATARATFIAERATHVRLNGAAAVSFAAVATQFNLPTVGDVVPQVADLAPAEQTVTATSESRQLGLLLAGLDQEANTLGSSDFALTDALATDLSSGNLDGVASGTPVMIGQSIPLPPDAVTTMLQSAVNSFAASTENQTNTPAPQVSSTVTSIDVSTAPPVGLSLSESELFCNSDGSTYVAKFYATGPVGTMVFYALPFGIPQALDWTGRTNGLTSRAPSDPAGTVLVYNGSYRKFFPNFTIELWANTLDPTEFNFSVVCTGSGGGGSVGTIPGSPTSTTNHPGTTNNWNLTIGGHPFEPGMCTTDGVCTFNYSVQTQGLPSTPTTSQTQPTVNNEPSISETANLSDSLTINVRFSGRNVQLSGTGSISGSVGGEPISGTTSVNGTGLADAAFPSAKHASGNLNITGSLSVAGYSTGNISTPYQWTLDRIG